MLLGMLCFYLQQLYKEKKDIFLKVKRLLSCFSARALSAGLPGTVFVCLCACAQWDGGQQLPPSESIHLVFELGAVILA